MTKIRKTLIFVFILAFFIALIIAGNNPKFYINDIRMGYKGILIKRYFLKTDHYVIKISDSELDVVFLAHELVNNFEVGDSIIKLPNDNYCTIIKPNGVNIKLLYKFIPTKIRNDFRWPEEWKDKWLEASE
jgi:hypothetical protein